MASGVPRGANASRRAEQRCRRLPLCRMELASSTAMMMAGDSMRTRATAMWPPGASPCASRNWLAVTKVTALTEP